MWPILGSLVAHAATPASFALVVGSNRPGPGQAALQYADDDALRLHDVLLELGGFAVERLVDPDADTVWTALDRAEDALVAAGGPSVFVFAYSGHARARALDLGDETVDLDALEARLASLPATVVVALFDACQAGVGGAAKGVVPDASFSTVAVLDTAGMVVLASSTATELSQESPELGGSYFTNAVVTGLRGAADSDGDGRVTLFEVYGYAYHQTLRDTSATAIGGQHPTLASDLRGHGDLILTRTERADSHLVFAAGEDTQFLVAGEAGTVAVEGVKVPGRPLDLALAAGRYELVLRREGAISRCRVVLAPGGVHPLTDADCTSARTSGAPKGGPNPERLMLELGVGAMPNTDGRLTAALADLGWVPPFRTGIVDPVVSGSVAVGVRPGVALVGTFGNLATGRYQTTNLSQVQAFDDLAFVVFRGVVGARVTVLPDRAFSPYGLLQAGVAYGRVRFRSGAETHLGPCASGAVGVLATRVGAARWGGYAQVGGSFAPVLLDRVDGGGVPVVELGLRAGL